MKNIDPPLINKVYIGTHLAKVKIRVAVFQKGLVNSLIEAVDEFNRKIGTGYIKSVDTSERDGSPQADVRISLNGAVYQGNYDFNYDCAVTLTRLSPYRDNE